MRGFCTRCKEPRGEGEEWGIHFWENFPMCDRDMAIYCMFHIEPKVVMRNGMATVYHLCDICTKV